MPAKLAAQLTGSVPRLSGDSGAQAACRYDVRSPADGHADSLSIYPSTMQLLLWTIWRCSLHSGRSVTLMSAH